MGSPPPGASPARRQAQGLPQAGAAVASPAIVLYDDRCGFCTTNARRGMRYQRAGALRWLGNSTPEAQDLLRARGLLGKEEETLIVLDGEKAFLDSDAVVRSAQGLRWPWRAYAGLRFLPKRLRDRAYRKIAEDPRPARLSPAAADPTVGRGQHRARRDPQRLGLCALGALCVFSCGTVGLLAHRAFRRAC